MWEQASCYGWMYLLREYELTSAVGMNNGINEVNDNKIYGVGVVWRHWLESLDVFIG